MSTPSALDANSATIDFPTSTEILTLVRDKATKLVPPVAAMKAIELADNPSSTAAQIAGVISSDIRLTTQLLSLANSAAFAPVSPLTEVRAAVSRLGIKRVRNLVMATALASVMKQMPIEVEWANEAINVHGRLTAIVATKLTGRLPVALQGEEFAAGLIHDIGRLTLFSILGAKALEFDPLKFDESIDPRDSERALLGTDHCDVGALLLRSVGFPSSLLEAVMFHHEPESSRAAGNLVGIVALADAISNRLQREEPTSALTPRDQHVIAWMCEQNGWDRAESVESVASADFGSCIDEAACAFA